MNPVYLSNFISHGQVNFLIIKTLGCIVVSAVVLTFSSMFNVKFSFFNWR